jgi:hypothetical protein
MKIDWKFQPNEDGTSQGWNDSTIAQFKSKRLESLTRETIQNSLDAKSDHGKPVIVEFKEHSRKQEEIPNIRSLESILELCEKNKSTQNPDMIRELSLALLDVRSPKINILSISDYNTKGMEGPCEQGRPFYNYVKAVGQSGGSTERAGSHGLGKGAPLACSTLRSIVVATRWQHGRAEKGLLQGRAVLMSFAKAGKIYKGTGYWGICEGYQAIEPSDLPAKYKWMSRDAIGTTVHLLGWSSPKNWRELIIGYAIANFFAAFERKTLVIKVGGQELNHANLQAVANSREVRAAMDVEKSLEKLDDALAYLSCLKEDENVITEESQIKSLGRTSLRLRVEDKAPKKIALIRNNMLITDAVPGFWKRVPARLSDFVGVVEVLDQDGSQLIRSMEPPAHNDLSKDWLASQEDQRKGGQALERLATMMREFTDRHAGCTDEFAGRVEFMADFFADEAGDDRGQKIGDELNPNGGFTFSPKHIRLLPPSRISLDADGEDGDDDNESDGELDTDDVLSVDPNNPGDSGGGAGIKNGLDSDDETGERNGPASGDGDGGDGGEDASISEPNKNYDEKRDKPDKEINLDNVRIVRVSDREAKIYLTSPISATVYLRVHEVGADLSMPFEVTHCDPGRVENGAVQIRLKSSTRVCISAVLNRDIVGGLKLVASK